MKATYGGDIRLDSKNIDKNAPIRGLTDRIKRVDEVGEAGLPDYFSFGKKTTGTEEYWTNQTQAIEEAQSAVGHFGSSMSGAFTQGIMAGESLGEIFKNMGTQLAGMVLEALAFKAIMAALNFIPGVGDALKWLGIGGTSGRVSTSGYDMPTQTVGASLSMRAPQNIFNNGSSMNDKNIVGALTGIERRLMSLERVTKSAAGKPIVIDKKSFTRGISDEQNLDTKRNYKSR
jgi:hypothetical protein